MAATFIPVSASTIFSVEQKNTYMISLKALAKTLFNEASSNSLTTSSTFTHTTGIDSLAANVFYLAANNNSPCAQQARPVVSSAQPTLTLKVDRLFCT